MHPGWNKYRFCSSWTEIARVRLETQVWLPKQQRRAVLHFHRIRVPAETY